MGDDINLDNRIRMLCMEAARLLRAGEYRLGAEALRQALRESEHAGTTECSHLLDIVCEITAACRLCDNEAQWLEQAREALRNREAELRDELLALLRLSVGHADPDGDDGARERPRPEPFEAAAENDPPTIEAETDHVGDAGHSLTTEARTATSIVECPTLQFHCLGPFRTLVHGRPVAKWNSLKALSILKYLVAHPGRVISRDTLMEVFWPDSEPESARGNLHQAIYSLRRTIGGCSNGSEIIESDSNGYCLSPQIGRRIDFVEFEQHARAGRRYETQGQLAEAITEYQHAEAIYRGDFLEDSLYEAWTETLREQLHQGYYDIAERLCALLHLQGDWTAEIALCQRMLARDPCYENAHRRLIHCYLAQQQRYLAARQYRHCESTLRVRAGIRPSAETAALYQQIVA